MCEAVGVDPPGVTRVERGAAQQRVDLAHHELRLGLFVHTGPDVDAVGRGLHAHGVQFAAGHQAARGDGGQRASHDHLAGAVVPGQVHQPGRGEVLLEAQEETHVGAAEGVDGLVGIADGAEVPVRRGEQAQQQVLEFVDVLVLVNADPAEPVAVVRHQVGVGGEQGDRQRDQVVEVDQVPRAQRLVVAGHQVGEVGVDRAGRAGRRRRAPRQRALGRGHVGEQPAGLALGAVPDQLTQHGQPLRVVGHAEPGGAADPVVLLAQDAQAQRVEGGHGDAPRVLASQRLSLIHARRARRVPGPGAPAGGSGCGSCRCRDRRR